ncbi:cell division protein ZipA [Marinobacter sp.]|uniref:cell division protein ZipA n=1 Tax=Marinobacter sp. TaxID=50741 RepID=UPI0038512B73
MSLREWLIAIGILVILAIVIDGARRMRRARKDAMAISSGMGADDLEDSPLEDDFNSELPNGGARPVNETTLQERGQLKKAGKSRFANPDPKPTRPVIGSRPPVETSPPESPAATPGETEKPAASAGWSALEDEPDLDDGIVGGPRSMAGQAPEKTPPKKAESTPKAKAPPRVTSEVEENTARRETAARAADQPLAGANRPDAQEVIVINVLAGEGAEFSGPALKKLFEACGLMHGDMDIYHRHEETDTTSPVQFSVANAVEPGTFRQQDMASLSTPGISFFMSMPGPSNSLQAFDFMLETAQCVVRNLGGELKDERRSVMTPQTVEHCRQRVREFERKKRSKRG